MSKEIGANPAEGVEEARPAARAQIPEFFAGRSVLITGATGFMGKVLVERLLATCPDLFRVYLLVRTKKEVPPQTRLQELTQCPVFDVLRANAAAQLDKLRIVPGDISQPGLGLSEQSVQLLQEVSVVFNCAATVRFNEPLRRAVELNVLSVIRALQLADQLRDMAAFVHVSTAYCNTEQTEEVEERVYPPPRPLHRLLEDALSVPDDIDQAQRFVAPKPNTYTFTKALGEVVLERHGNKRYPLAIVRPTIVVPSLRTPFPGWVEGHHGPSATVLGVSSGLLRVYLCDAAARCDLLPVDLAIDTMIAVAWETALDKLPSVRVYNCSTGEHPTTWGALRRAALAHARRHPLRNVCAYPVCHMTPHSLVYRALLFTLQTAPLHLAEYVLRVFSNNKKRMNLIKLSSRLSAASESTGYFATREWRFSSRNVRRLRARLAPADAALFNLDPRTIQWEQYYQDFTRGCRLYLNQDKEENLPQARKRLKRIHLVQRSFSLAVPLFVIRRLLGPSPHYTMLAWVTRLASALRDALTRASVSLALLAANLALLVPQFERECSRGIHTNLLSVL